MKRTLLLSALICLALITALKPQKAAAQVTALTVYGNPGYMSIGCALPDTVSLGIQSYPTGVPVAGDSVTIYASFDDGYDTTFKMADTALYLYIYHAYTLPGNYTTHFTVTTTGGVTASWTAAIPLMVADSCSALLGKAYVDANGNGTYDAGEPPISHMPVLLTLPTSGDTIYAAWTDDTGGYAINLPANNYVLMARSFTGAAIAPSSPATGSYSLTVTGGGTYTENYGFACVAPTTLDMSATGYSRNVKRGDSAWAIDLNAGDWWWWEDYTCASLSSTVTLTLDPHLHYLPTYSSFSVPPVVSGSTLTFHLVTATDHFRFGASIRVYCDLTTVMGEVLTNTVTVTPTSITDPDLTNNTRTFNCTVVSAWDPNGIEVSPQGTGVQGYIPNGTSLTYAVHFQNTGTATASNVTVTDTLDANLDPKTLYIISSSSPVELQTVGNAAKFFFSGINLPDSLSNPNGSIGHIVYGAMPKSSLAPGTQIHAKASIYFDYNPAVVTNSALNTIQNTTAVQQGPLAAFSASVYPNPANDAVVANTEDRSDFTMTIIDMLGRTIANGKSTNGHATVATRSIPAGLYVVRLTNTNGQELTTKLAIQH